jgi:RNA polymerase primary sigma factor
MKNERRVEVESPTDLRLTDRTLVLYLKELNKFPLLRPEEERELARQAREGSIEARNRLITANLRSVVWIARRYQNRGLPLADLINEGNRGLIQAIKKFDERKKTRLLTYAAWWIRYAIVQALAERKLVKFPLKARLFANRLKNVYLKVAQKLGREPTLDELALEVKIDPKTLSEAFLASYDELSIDQQAFPDGSPSWQDRLVSKTFPSPEESFHQQALKAELNRALSILKKREREVIERFFGLNDGVSQSLSAIGRSFGVSREAVRQVKERALKKLKGQIEDQELRELFKLSDSSQPG